MESDLHMNGYDYNIILTSFYIGYILLEIPSVILCKAIGPGWFLPCAAILFGLCSVFTAYVTTVSQACAVRFLLGVFEAGMLPGTAYYLSRWYRRSELTFRLSLYVAMAALAGAFGGVLASAILTLPSVGNLTSWRMLFVIEGIITIGVSLVALIFLADRPETASWLTPEEKHLAITRIESERRDTPLLDKLSRRRFVRGAKSPVTVCVGVIFCFNAMVVQSMAFFLPTIVRAIYPEFTTVKQQLFSAPPYLLGSAVLVVASWLSWKVDTRQVFFLVTTLPVIVGYIMFLAAPTTDQKVRYAATFLASIAFTMGSLTNAQVAANVVTDTARSAAIGVNSMFAHVGGLVGSWAFLPWDGPLYPIGNGLNLACSAAIFILSGLLWVWMVRDNRNRDSKAAAAAAQDGSTGLGVDEDEDDMEWEHPAFRWRP